MSMNGGCKFGAILDELPTKSVQDVGESAKILKGEFEVINYYLGLHEEFDKKNMKRFYQSYFGDRTM